MTLKAKSIVENKFWVLENESGERIGTIAQNKENVRFTVNDTTEIFPTMKEMLDKKGVIIARKTREKKPTTVGETEVYGYPTSHTPHNTMWNVKLKLPIYTKNEKSSSYYCAGYYIIKFDKSWSRCFTPKLITLQRYQYHGPYKNKIEQSEKFRNIIDETS